MDFSNFALALQEISNESEIKKENNLPISIAKKINLNPEEHLAEINRLKKQQELSSKNKQKKNKKIERSKGYYDKLELKDKINNKNNKKDLKNKKNKK